MDSNETIHTAARPAPHERSRWTWPLRILGGVLALVFVAWLVLYLTKGRFLKDTVVGMVESRIERDVTVGGDFNLYLNPFHIQFLAEDLTIANPAWAKDKQLLTAKRAAFQLNIWKLIFGGRRVFNDLELTDASAGLERQLTRNTWSFDGSNDPFTLPDIRRAAITGTRIHYLDVPLVLDTDIRVGDIGARNTRIQPRVPFEGGGTSHGARFTVAGALTAPNETLAGGKNGLDLTIRTGDSRVRIYGTLPAATVLQGSDLRLDATGKNLTTPFRMLGAAVPATRRYNVTSKLTLDGDDWKFTTIAGTFGDSDLNGTMTISRPAERLLVIADLSSRSLDILDAGPWIGYSPERLDAMGGKGAITMEGGHPRILPDTALASAETLDRFDAKVAYKAAKVRTGSIPVANLDLELGLDHKLLTLKPVSFDLAGGRLTADIAIDARKLPVATDYDIRLSPMALSKLMTGFKVEESGVKGTIKGRIQLKGSGDTVRKSLASANGRIAIILPAGTFWIRNIELLELDLFQYFGKGLLKKLKDPSDVRCGLLGFTVRNGVAQADPIFIDTQRNVIRGTGNFTFDDESLNLSIKADSKKFSLFSGQSPIGVGGYFAAPTVNPISGKLLTRAGVGIGLGLVATPFAALLAFVDPGEEKDTDCTAVLAGARGPAVKAADKAAEKR